MSASREWTRFAVGSNSHKQKWVSTDAIPFDTVFYICHVRDAVRIFEDGRIRSSLVWDESKLRNTRTCVSWVSPNHWVSGSIYGNIRFDFDWRALVEGKQFYWVEAMERYRPPAYRILISDRDHAPTGLKPYNPKKVTGPLYHDSKNDQWYRHSAFTGEFLIDEDLWLADCKMIGFEAHHPNICRNLRSLCLHLGKDGAEPGAELIARLVAHNCLRPKELFFDLATNRRRLHGEAARAVRHLRRFLLPKACNGTVKHDHVAASQLVSAMLDTFGLRRPKATARLGRLFASRNDFCMALDHRIVKAFGLKSKSAMCL